MEIPEELLLSITQSLTRSHGPDIAHDVAIALLRRRNPLHSPKRWAMVYAVSLARKRASCYRQPRIVYMSELPIKLTAKMRDYGLES